MHVQLITIDPATSNDSRLSKTPSKKFSPPVAMKKGGLENVKYHFLSSLLMVKK